MMTLYGMTDAEMKTLRVWALKFSALNGRQYIQEIRHEWLLAGGKMPVTEAQALFLRPAQRAG